MLLEWVKCEGDVWCSFERLDLSNVISFGVYVIWKPPALALSTPQVIRVGQGNIAERIAAHRLDPEITQYGPGLLVTWAEVLGYYVDGVEAFLAQQLRPAVGDRFPLAPPIAVNLPGAA